MTPRNPDLPDGADAKSPTADRRAARSWLVRGAALAVLGIVLIVGTALGWFPLGEDPFVRHVPQLVGVLMIGQGVLWVARSRAGQDDS